MSWRRALHPCPACGGMGVDRFLAVLSVTLGAHLAVPAWDSLSTIPVFAGMLHVGGDGIWSALFIGGALVKGYGLARGRGWWRLAGSIVLTFAWTSVAVSFLASGFQFPSASLFTVLAVSQLVVTVRTTRRALWSRPDR